MIPPGFKRRGKTMLYQSYQDVQFCGDFQFDKCTRGKDCKHWHWCNYIGCKNPQNCKSTLH